MPSESHLCVCHLSLPSGLGWGALADTLYLLCDYVRLPEGVFPVSCAMTAESRGTRLNAFPRQLA